MSNSGTGLKLKLEKVSDTCYSVKNPDGTDFNWVEYFQALLDSGALKDNKVKK